MTYFDDWAGVARVVVTAVAAYVALIVLLRVSGKRTLAQLNLFDWIVTVALGSTLAGVVLTPDVPLVEGVAALATLVGLQFAVAYIQSRTSRVEALVKAAPRLLAHDGELLFDAMQAERVTEREVAQAVREHGAASVEDVYAVVLETNGRMTVVREKPRAAVDVHALRFVRRADLDPGTS